jgi:transporter family protein
MGGFAVWILYALLSAMFAALTSILAKMGLEGVNSNLATAIRTVVVLLMAWGIVFITGKQNDVTDITSKSWLFLLLSGLATGLSWLFFFKALQMGEASKVVPIDKLSVVIAMAMAFFILREKADVKSIIGGILIAIGTLVIVV